RRRHTRFSRDWSSDVCSSDLAIRASSGAQPCFCLCLGFSQITITRLLRLTILHFSQMRLTDARTFTLHHPSSSAQLPEPVGDPASGRIVGREFHFHPVAGEDADEVDPHLAR